LIFGAVFGAFGFKVCKKNRFDRFIFFKSKKVLKNAEFHADFKSVENSFKKIHEKIISKTSLTNMSKSGKVHIFVMFLPITFFCTFLKTFSMILKSA
jgi:hypothetical protein